MFKRENILMYRSLEQKTEYLGAVLCSAIASCKEMMFPVGFCFSACNSYVVSSNQELFYSTATIQIQTLTSLGSLYIITAMANSCVWSAFRKDKACSSKFFHAEGTKGKQIQKNNTRETFR